MSESVTQTPPPAPSPIPPAPALPTKPRRRLLKVLVGLIVCVIFGVAAAPVVVAKTSLRNRFARQAAADLNGTLDIGGASLGWFSTIELRDLTLTDPQGRVVARIPKLTSSRSLLGLLRDRADLGEFTLHDPTVDVVCEAKTSNLETMLARYLEARGEPRGPTRPQVAIRVSGGTLTLHQSGQALAGAFRDINATVSVPAARSEPVAVKVAGLAPGKFDADVVVGESGRVKFVSDGFALELLAPLLDRFGIPLDSGGLLSGDATATWGKDSLTLDGTLGGKNLAFSGSLLKGDTLRLASASLPIKATLTGRAIRVERAELVSDIGKVSLTGAFDPAEPIEKLLDRPGTKLDADVDLAKLAAGVPKLLRIRGGTEIRDGKLVVSVASRATAEGTAWTGKLDASALRAVRDQREVKWEEPLSIEFAGRFRPHELPILDKLICRSDFIAIQAEIKPDSIRAAANVFLDRLAVRLADFVDLGGATLDGRGTVTVVAQRNSDQSFKAESTVELTQFAFTDHHGRGLKEPQLSFRLTGSGKAPEGGPILVSAATATLTAGADELHLTLKEPIADAKQLSSGRVDAKLTGDLGRWWARVGSLVSVPKHYVLGGAATAHGSVRFAPDLIAMDRLTLTLVNARFRGAGLDLEEEQMDAVADLSINRAAGSTTFENFTINSHPLSVTNGRLVIQTPRTGDVVVEGGGPAVVGLARLGKTLKLYGDPRGPESIHGRGTGPIHFRYAGDITTFGGTLDVVSLSVGLPTAPDWTEPSIRLEAEGSYTESSDALAFTVARLDRPGFALDTIASFSKLATTCDLKLTGSLTYDLAKLTPKLREALGGGFAAQGRGTTPVSLAGSLTPPAAPGPFAAMNGGLKVAWNSLHAYGFDVGRGDLDATLTNGVCRTNPIAATFGGGKVHVQPTLHLETAPGFVTFEKGTIVEHAKLTPAVCADALGYALPAIARSGKAEGDISIFLGENRIPFAEMNKALVKGRITIHQAAVLPGPVVGEIAKLIGVSNLAMTITKETVVPIRVENGAVHHQNFAVQIGGQTIITSGSVGFDGKLNLLADVPVPASLLRGSPVAARALAGKRVTVPIAGTLARPAIDPRLFQAAIARLAQEAGRDIGKDLLNKELQKLFPGMPKK